MFSGLTTLRKLCNHPDLVTNDYSELCKEGEFTPVIGLPKKRRKKGEGTYQQEQSCGRCTDNNIITSVINGHPLLAECLPMCISFFVPS